MMQYLDVLMVFSLVAFLLAGYPVAWTLGGVAVIFGLIGFGFDFFLFLPLRIWGRMTNFTLVAVPLFIFMGILLERSKLAEELLESMGALMGRARGGLAISVVLVGAVLGATTGIVGATVVTMGVISLPIMMKRGYSKELATGVISASGTLGQIIPPSIVLIILGDMMGLSVGELFAGAMLPGLVLVGLYILYILVLGLIRPGKVPRGGGDDASELNKRTMLKNLVSLLPALFLVVVVLGSILVGLASPTEAAGVGAAGALVLTIAKRKFTFTILRESLVTATRLCSMVFMVLIAATAFGLVFRGLGGDEMIKTFFMGIGGNKWGILAIIMGMLFFLGFFLDIIEIIFIVIPLLLPIIETLGFNMLWVGVLIAVNFQTSFLTPPIGFSLFFLKGVCPPSVTTTHIYRGVMPFIILQLIGLTLIILLPSFVTWLPGILYK